MKNFYFAISLLTIFNYNSNTENVFISEHDIEVCENLIKHDIKTTVTEQTNKKQYIVPCILIIGISAVLLYSIYKHYKHTTVTEEPFDSSRYCDAFFNSLKPFFNEQKDSSEMVAYKYCYDNIEQFEIFCKKNKCTPLIDDYKFLLKHVANFRNYCDGILPD